MKESIFTNSNFCSADSLTELVFLLDRSGSMAGLEADTIGGFNSMIQKQKREPGKALVSTVLFDDRCEVIYDRVPLDSIPPMTDKVYYPRGCTALLDAMGGAIHRIGLIHRYIRPEDRPARTLFVITTDGMENASHRYRLPDIKRMIERQKKRYGWEFLFLGANIDAVSTASRFGIGADRAVTYRSDSAGTRLNYDVVSDAVCQFRSGAPMSADWKAPIEADLKQRGADRTPSAQSSRRFGFSPSRQR